MATIILNSDYDTIEANLHRIFPGWDGGQFKVTGVLDEGKWHEGPNATWDTDARRFAEHVKCFGYDGYTLAIANCTQGDVRREELLRPLPGAAPIPVLRGELDSSTYDTTDAFRRIECHTAVCDARNGALIAVTGPAGDPESEAYAQLFAAAPEAMVALELLVAQVRSKWPDAVWSTDTSAWGKPMRAALAALAKAGRSP